MTSTPSNSGGEELTKSLLAHSIEIDEEHSASQVRPAPENHEDVQPTPSPTPEPSEHPMATEDSHGLPVVQCSSSEAIMNLVNTTIGAGMMALPLAFARLGLGVGALALFLCGWLTSFSLVGLVKASVRTQCLSSYADLVKAKFGARGSSLLQLAIIANNAGSLIIYLIIVMDVLVGTAPEYSGLLSLLLPQTGRVWYLSRPFIIALVCTVLLAPLIGLKNMAALSRASVVAVASAAFFALSTVSLTARALSTGKALGVNDWAPSEEELGTSWPQITLGVVSTVPILVTSFLCHFNIHSVMAELRKFSERKMKRICRVSMAITFAIYLFVGAGACLIFGRTTKEDVLENFSVPVLSDLLAGNRGMTVVLSAAVRLSYAVSLLFTFPLVFYPLRGTLVEMVGGISFQELDAANFYGVSYALLFLFFVVSTQAPGIWIALQISGSTASVLISFIIPAFLVLKMEKAAGRNKPHVTVLCYSLAGLGVIAGGVGVGSVMRDIFAPKEAESPSAERLLRIGYNVHTWMFK